LDISKRSIWIVSGWAIFQALIQFTVIISERNSVQPVWFLATFVMSVLSVAQVDAIEGAVKHWIASIVLSIIILLLLLSLPMLLGVVSPVYIPLMILGSLRTMASTLLLTTPIGLISCFAGQVVRNKYL